MGTVKKMASEMDFLSHYDPEKEIFIQTDGSKTGLGYILFQPGDEETKDESGETNEKGEEGTKKTKKNLGHRIITMGATGLTPGQKNWSIFETELLCVVWALEHARYYCIGAPKITIKTDHSPLKGLFKKELSKIDNPRVVKLLEKTLHHNIEVQTVAGKDNAAADALSRMGCKDTLAPDITRNFYDSRESKVDKVRIKKLEGPLDLKIIAKEAHGS